MVKVEYVPVSELKALRRKMKKRPIVEEYESMLKDLPEGQGGKIDTKKEKEKPATVKNRIVRIAKSLDMTDLKVKRTGDIVSFWRE